jgi:transcriptional regulator with GAF, ATPase, and Fis domain
MADKVDSSSVASPTLILSSRDDRNRILVQKCKLLAVSGPLKSREFVVKSDTFTIGSGRSNDLMLEDSTVSRRHCEIQLSPEGYSIRDLGSTNGTYVQGVRIKSAFLDEGTEFQLGSTRLVFCPMQEMMEYKLSKAEAFGSLLGRSVPMRRVFHIAERYAKTDSTIMIEGETGTGKEILAEEIHRHSNRKDKPFIVIDCASLAKDLVASELFGHGKGAFTGAITDRVGAFEHADGGTVFLDEIGDLSPELQPQLLRVLEKREVKRVGTNTVRKINVRIISATNKKLQNEVNVGNFREDLYFRLSVINIELPPLRKRKDDIAMLAEAFLTEFLGAGAPLEMANVDEAARAFRNHDWPGNVRELRNLVEIASHSEEEPIDLAAFLYLGRSRRPQSDNSSSRFTADRPFKVVKQELIQEFEMHYIADLLKRHDDNVSQAARHADIERAYLQRLIRKYGLRDSQPE